MKTSTLHLQRGISMIEVLITIVILVVGLLGLAGLQLRLQLSEMEAYQRSQALLLLEDIASRIANNRNNAASYVTGASDPLGAGMTCPTTTATRQQADAGEWCDALQGAAETLGGSKVGALVGGRGCVENPAAGEYLVTVSWQGLRPISAPPTGLACGQDLYDGAAGSTCQNDLCRRSLSTIVRIATLS